MVVLTRVAVLLIATAAIGVEASKVGHIIKGSVSNVIKGTVSSVIKVRGQNSLWERDEGLNELGKLYPDCMSALKAGPHPHVIVNADQSMAISSMPSECMTKIEAHNASPDATKAEEDGTATVTGPNSVLLKGVAPDILDFFKQN